MADKMTFKQAVRQMRDLLFWDFTDGQWLDTLYMPLTRAYFNMLMESVTDAHDREVAEYRRIIRVMHDTINDLQATFDVGITVGGVELDAEYFAEWMRELGIEVDSDE